MLFYQGCTEPAYSQFSQQPLHLSCHKIWDANRGWINPATFPITACSLNLTSLHQIYGYRAASLPGPSAAGTAAGAGPATPWPLSPLWPGFQPEFTWGQSGSHRPLVSPSPGRAGAQNPQWAITELKISHIPKPQLYFWACRGKLRH